MGLVLTTPAATELVSDADAKEYLRVDSGDTSQNNIITILIAAAGRKIENHLRRSLIAQTWTYDYDSDAAQTPIWLPRPTVNSITSLKTYSSDGATTTTVNSANYELVEGVKLVARADGWEINRKERAGTIVYIAGPYANTAAVPSDIKLAAFKIIATMYEMREDVSAGTIAPTIEQDSAYLLEDYRYYGP